MKRGTSMGDVVDGFVQNTILIGLNRHSLLGDPKDIALCSLATFNLVRRACSAV